MTYTIDELFSPNFSYVLADSKKLPLYVDIPGFLTSNNSEGLPGLHITNGRTFILMRYDTLQAILLQRRMNLINALYRLFFRTNSPTAIMFMEEDGNGVNAQEYAPDPRPRERTRKGVSMAHLISQRYDVYSHHSKFILNEAELFLNNRAQDFVDAESNTPTPILTPLP